MSKDRVKNILKNVFPGFVVSLIALPLSLGLSLASGAPPIAGLIAAIVGGILVSFIGGTNLAITGPGNGLVVVTLTAITTLGAGDMYAGYLYTLAAIAFSGLILFLLGLFRFGLLGDFFPSAAVQGMLAAIGVIIMAKQIHVMLGVMDPQASNPIDLLLTVPQSIAQVVQGQVPAFAWVFGLLSLFFLFAYSRFRNPIVQLIPAPMWVVLVGIGLSYFAEFTPNVIAPLGESYLVDIPNSVLNNLAFPDFGKVTDKAFVSAVVSLTFISAIESLLSIKAVDRLDPEKRRSNVNKSLRAIGIATMVSSFLGGLNVVKVIARSSVNIQQGAKGRSSNFFHGFFLLLFILLFASQLQRIPLSALAAILVFTGYKLTAPAVFKSIGKVGLEQLIIFLITMISTLLTNLITGIMIGVLVTLLAQLLVITRVKVITRNFFKPNTLLFEEDEDQYHISVRAYSNFLNFIGIKKKLDTIPRSSKVIVDFSLTEFVDYSVLEQLQNYHQTFRSSGGDLEVIGIDNMSARSTHPLAPRKPEKPNKNNGRNVSRRQKSIRLFAKMLNYTFSATPKFGTDDFQQFQYFQTRKIDNVRNRADGWEGRVKVILADVHYYEGEYTAQQHLHSTMVEMILPKDIPEFVLDKENLLDRVAHLAGFNDINFDRYPAFSHRFKLKADDTAAVKNFFDGKLITFIEDNKEYHIESNGKALLIFEKERLSTISEIKQLVSFASRLASLLNNKL